VFYVSKYTVLFFVLAFFSLVLSLVFKLLGQDFTYYGKVAVFGFILTTIIGAFYQIIPNSQQQKLSLEWISAVVLVLSTISIYYLSIQDLEKSSFFLLASSVLTSVHLASVVRNIAPLTVKYLLFALFYLVLSPLFLFLSIKNPQFSLQIAIHTLTLGVMINAVLGVQTAWIPMIYMQTLGKTKVGRFLINSLVYVHQVVILSILVGFYFGNYKAVGGFALLEASLIMLFLKFVFYDSIKPQIKLHGVPYQVKFFITGHLFLTAGLITAHIIAVKYRFELIPIHIDFVVYGFAVFTIIGGMVHLTPRIIWNLVHIKKAREMKQMPNLKGVISRPRAEKLFFVTLVGYLSFLMFEILGFSQLATFIYILAVILVFGGFSRDFYRLYTL